MQNLLTVSYWFAQLPQPFVPWIHAALLAKFALMVVIGFVIYLIARKKRESLYWRDGIARFSPVLVQTGIIGLILVWIADQQIQFFGMRIWLAVLGVWFIIRIVLVILHIVKKLPKRAAEEAEKARLKKYLP